ncbi:MAG: Uma2 family endonuclease [Cyanobacteria bacterium P01_C01_bin.89]
MFSTQPRTYTVDEYRDREQTAEQRHEYRNGEIIPITGGSRSHNKIAANLLRLLDLNTGLEKVLKLEAIALELQLRSIYRGIAFD